MEQRQPVRELRCSTPNTANGRAWDSRRSARLPLTSLEIGKACDVPAPLFGLIQHKLWGVDALQRWAMVAEAADKW